MALVKCPECDKEISDQASKCVHCGYQLKVMTQKTNEFAKVILIVGLIIILVCFSGYKYVQYQHAETLKQQEIDKAKKNFDKALEDFNKSNGF